MNFFPISNYTFSITRMGKSTIEIPILICKHLDKDVTCFASKSKILGEGQLAPLPPVSAGSAKYTTSAKDLPLYKKFLLFWLWSIEFDLEFLLQKM